MRIIIKKLKVHQKELAVTFTFFLKAKSLNNPKLTDFGLKTAEVKGKKSMKSKN